MWNKLKLRPCGLKKNYFTGSADTVRHAVKTATVGSVQTAEFVKLPYRVRATNENIKR